MRPEPLARIRFPAGGIVATSAGRWRYRQLLAAAALLLVVACGPAPSPGVPATPTPSEVAPPASATAPPASAATAVAPAATPLAAVTPEPAPATPTAPPDQLPVVGPTEHDGQRAHEHVRALAEQIGPRVAGTAGETAAVRYIQEQLAAWGYHVDLITFSFPDPFRSGTVQVDDEQLAALPMIGSPPGRVAGQAVDAGLGRSEDVAGLDLRGKVAIARRGEIPFGEKLASVQATGAVALVVVNNEPGPFRGDLGREAEIPVLGVDDTADAPLRAAAQAGRTVTVEASARATAQSVVVLATAAPGTRCQVLVGAHHDTVPNVPGANDNASGTANVLELARAFAADGLDQGLCFATFGAEESGLHGSRALANRLQAEDALPRAMVNLDVTGAGRDVEVIGSNELVAQALDLAARRGIPARAAGLPDNVGSDHQSFARLGVPVVFFTSGDFSAIHTPRDTVDGVQPDELDRVGDLAFATIAALLSPD